MTSHPIPDAALDADIAILGKKGRGKTYTAKGIVERLLDMKRRVLIIDPLSVWWGLKSSSDGTRKGYPIAVFGGPRGDMPLTEEMGRPLARIIATENMPTVLDIGEMRKGAWQRLVADVLDELFTTNRDPLWIVLEEADVFAPQNPREGDSVRVLYETDRIARRGRAYGFRLMSITQRPARIHKDVLTQLSTLVALGITSPQDRDAIKTWVEGNADRDTAKEVMDSLAKLKVGEGWVWAPDHEILKRVTFPAIKTLDTSATPKAGERKVEVKTLAQVDLTAVKEAIALAATEKTEEPKKPTPAVAAPSQEEIVKAESRGYDKGYQAGAFQARTDLCKIFGDAAQKLADDIRSNGGGKVEDIAVRSEISSPPAPTVEPLRSRTSKQKRTTVPTGPAPHSSTSAPGSARLLEAIDTIDGAPVTWAAAALRAGYAESGGGFRKAKKELLETGQATDEAGYAVPTSPRRTGSVPDRDALIGLWISKLHTSAATLLGALASASEAIITINDLAERAGYAPTGGGFRKGVKLLRSSGLVESADRTTISISRAFREAIGEKI